MSTTDIQAAVNAGIASTEPSPIGEHLHAVVVPDGGTVKIIDQREHDEAYLDHPRRKSGAVTLRTAESFVEYVARHAADGTEVWADVDRAQVLAIIDSHAEEHPGYGLHRATLALKKTDAWKAWADVSGKVLAQATFAELIEDRSVDVVEPSAAALLEIAQTFRATKGVDFESSHRLSTGEVSFVYREQINATAGKKGELTIPERFTLALAPFEGVDPYKITARLRFRLTEGSLAIGFVLDRPDDVLRAAFGDVVDAINDGFADNADSLVNGLPFFTGWPTA